MKDVRDIKFILAMVVCSSIVLGCGSGLSRVEQRRMEIRQADSLELLQARDDLAAADSVVTFASLELDDMKQDFVFEKQEQYQTTGYFVLPAYAGNKSRFSFFPEVEEGGAFLLVSIDRQRHYTFHEINPDENDFASQLPQTLTDKQREDVARCHALAKAMRDVREAQKRQEKLRLKVRFYERKLQKTNT